MPFTRIADPDQLKILRQALEQHCAARGIIDAEGREHIAEMVMFLFSRGLSTPDEINEALSTMTDFQESKRA